MLLPPIPARGVFILGILCVFIGGALALLRGAPPVIKSGGMFAPISAKARWWSTTCS
jgi:cytochrome c biogenesis factor